MPIPPYMWLKDDSSESVSLQYEKITWRIVDGNIQYTDAWNERSIA
jgi:type VI secretion system secreted protein Hcp